MTFGLATIIIGHGTFCIVVVYNNTVARLRRTEGSLEEASSDLGADAWQTFRHVTLPQMRTALLAGGLLAFALSFDEVVVTIFTSGAQQTLPIWVYANLFRPIEQPVVNVVVLFVIVVSIIPVWIAQRLAAAGDDGSEGAGTRHGARAVASALRALATPTGQQTPVPPSPQYPLGFFGEVLLVVRLGVEERPGLRDLGRDRGKARARELRLEQVASRERLVALRCGLPVDRRAVLRSAVVPLPHPLGRVVPLPEEAQNLGGGDPLGIVDDEDDLGVPRPARAHLLVGRVRGDPARVADSGGEHAGCLPEDPLGAPEAAHADDEALEAVGKRRDERGSENERAARARRSRGRARRARCRPSGAPVRFGRRGSCSNGSATRVARR